MISFARATDEANSQSTAVEQDFDTASDQGNSSNNIGNKRSAILRRRIFGAAVAELLDFPIPHLRPTDIEGGAPSHLPLSIRLATILSEPLEVEEISSMA